MRRCLSSGAHEESARTGMRRLNFLSSSPFSFQILMSLSLLSSFLLYTTPVLTISSLHCQRFHHELSLPSSTVGPSVAMTARDSKLLSILGQSEFLPFSILEHVEPQVMCLRGGEGEEDQMDDEEGIMHPAKVCVITNSGKNYSFADGKIFISKSLREKAGTGDIVKVKAKELVKENKWIATHIRLVQRNNTKFLENKTKSEAVGAQETKKMDKKVSKTTDAPADGGSGKVAKKSSAAKVPKTSEKSSEKSSKKTSKKSSKKAQKDEAEKMSDESSAEETKAKSKKKKSSKSS
eukprot:750514-Hanusia_phi.AAC.2